MIEHTIFIDNSNFNFIDRESAEIDIVSNVLTKFDKPYRLQIGDHFHDLYSILMYEDKCGEKCIKELVELLKKYEKAYDGLDVLGFLLDDPNEDTLFTIVRLNFV